MLKQRTSAWCGFDDLADIHSPATLLGAASDCFFSQKAYQPITGKQLAGVVIYWEKRRTDAALKVLNTVVVGCRQAACFTNCWTDGTHFFFCLSGEWPQKEKISSEHQLCGGKMSC